MPKLSTVKRKDLDTVKYSEAIQTALNYRIYAEYWYLDTVTGGKWECLVYGDYEVVMPIPLQSKFGFKFVIQPLFCQQLGVFYKEKISKELFKAFENRLHKYRVRIYSFNEENTESFQPEGDDRVNYLLNLNRLYDEIFEDFEKDRKKDIRRNQKLNFSFSEELQTDKFFELLKTEYENLASQLDLKKLNDLIENLSRNKSLISYSLLNSDLQILSACFLAKSGMRLILLFSARDKSLETKGAFTYLMSHLIQQNSNREFILDFEGSMIPGIAGFNRSFGAKPNIYRSFSNFSKPF